MLSIFIQRISPALVAYLLSIQMQVLQDYQLNFDIGFLQPWLYQYESRSYLSISPSSFELSFVNMAVGAPSDFPQNVIIIERGHFLRLCLTSFLLWSETI